MRTARDIDWSLYLVTDRTLPGGKDLLASVARAVSAGVTVVQLREKEITTRAFVALAEDLVRLLRPRGIPLIVNDRIDVALAADADGAHVGQDDMPAALARRLLGERRLLGVSVSTPDEAIRAVADGADHLGAGVVFPTATKTDYDGTIGLAGLAAITAVATVPIVAIGGIGAANIAGLAALPGLAGVAVVSAILGQPDPGAAAAGLAALWRTR